MHAFTRHFRLGTVLALALAPAPTACGGSMSGPHVPDGVLRVLFIGNSLTYTNDLPAMVSALAEASGTRPSSLPVNRDSLRLWSQDWAAEIRGAGGVPALYAVWPDELNFGSFGSVSESYRQAAVAVNGLSFPVGDAWLATWETQSDISLYGPDRFHPGVDGSYADAAAAVLAQVGAQPIPQ